LSDGNLRAGSGDRRKALLSWELANAWIMSAARGPRLSATLFNHFVRVPARNNRELVIEMRVMANKMRLDFVE
jgi:hypothetical protein